jgi:hypothetical protein
MRTDQADIVPPYSDDPFTLSDGTGPLHAETVGRGRYRTNRWRRRSRRPGATAGLLAAQLAVFGRQVDGGRVEGQPTALMRAGRPDDLLAAADGIGALDEQVVPGGVNAASPGWRTAHRAAASR